MTQPNHYTSLQGLAKAVNKERAFESKEQEAYLNLLRTHGDLSAAFDRLFKEHGVSQPQYNVLRILRGWRGRAIAEQRSEHGVPMQRIAEDMITREPDMTRLVNRLERSGFVERARCEEDRRVTFVRITERGLGVVDGLDDPLMDLHRRQLSHMSAERLDVAIAVLEEMREGGGSSNRSGG